MTGWIEECMYVRMCVCMYVCTYVRIYVCVCVCVSYDFISIISRNSINRMVFVMGRRSLLEGRNRIIKFDLHNFIP
jgi:hypothetical protein